jgi:uncharacterized protein YggE
VSDPRLFEPGITVVGAGTASAVPDVLVLDVGAEVRHRDVSAALGQASAALSAMTARLRAGGVPEEDLRTAGASLWSQTDENGRLTGHVASQQLTAKLRDLSGAGDLVVQVIAAGGDAARLHGLSFALDDNTELLVQARERAFADARARAEQYAALAGRALGPVRRVSESTGTDRPLSLMKFAAADSMPVQAGTQEIAASVEVEWTFAD